MIINVDVDGVLTNGFVEAMPVRAHREGWTIPEDNVIDKWAFYEDWLDRDSNPGTFSSFYEHVWGPATCEGLYSYMSYDHSASQYLKQLMDEGHFIRIITSLTFPNFNHTLIAREDRASWIKMFGVPHHDLVFVSGSKRPYTADVIIDDKPTEDWQQDDGINIVFWQPWNDDFESYDYKTNCWENIALIIEENDG